MIASLQMYDWPELRDAYDELWSLIASRLRETDVFAPKKLTRYEQESNPWLSRHLVLSQTCGYPYRTVLHERVNLVGTPDYAVDGCPPGYYRSGFAVRKSDPRADISQYRDARFAYNVMDSQSGYVAPRVHLKDKDFWFAEEVQSGGHQKSAAMVATGDADIASLDAVSWRYLQQFDSMDNELRILEFTEPSPGLPYICARDVDATIIFDAIQAAIPQMSSDRRQLLGISGIVSLPAQQYLDMQGL